MDIDHLHGGELFQDTTRGQPGHEGMNARSDAKQPGIPIESSR
ncbi:MAG TPA: hypothetical protein VK822_31230 [Acetobacteraceae bacterium]|nr:hypothetical protein [Acetobacteraceae bacterium]